MINMNAKEAWKQWTDAVMREAAEIDAAGDALASITLETSPLIDVGPAGREILDRAISSLATDLGAAVARMRDRTTKRLNFVSAAKWLGDPKRSNLLGAIAEPTRESQHHAVRRANIPLVSLRAAQNRGLFRWRDSDAGDQTIDRIVEGARLYAATKA